MQEKPVLFSFTLPASMECQFVGILLKFWLFGYRYVFKVYSSVSRWRSWECVTYPPICHLPSATHYRHYSHAHKPTAKRTNTITDTGKHFVNFVNFVVECIIFEVTTTSTYLNIPHPIYVHCTSNYKAIIIISPSLNNQGSGTRCDHYNIAIS